MHFFLNCGYFGFQARWLAAVMLSCCASLAVCGEPVVYWNFVHDMQGWKANEFATAPQHTEDGASFDVRSPDPFLTSPVVDCPVDQFLVVSLRMRSTGSTNGQLYFGKKFSESRSLNFSVKNDGQWHDYRISLPSLRPGTRIRLDPSNTDGKITLAWVRIDSYAELPHESWAKPQELRDRKFIGGGLYTIYGEETAITPSYIEKHPEFVDSYPFDGIVMPAPLSPEWVVSLGLTKMGMPWRPVFLNELLWNKILIPVEAVSQTIDDLKSMRRGSLTDNFLIFGMVDGARGLHTPDLSNDADWAIIEQNARLAARICREGKLKGFWLDTEQYGFYRWRTESGTPEFDPEKPQGLHFPLGKDTPDVLRRRGSEWIRAVQAEFPQVKIMTTFAWSPDANGYGPLHGVIPFLDGVLEGIESPGQIIHGHENTFYFGQAKGTTHTYATENGFPGDRNRYAAARTEIRGWSSLSHNPDKYDRFVQVGMAAWVEDHPWNVPDGWPIGSKASFWSNLPLALAYTDEYVWVWAEHTKYGQSHLRDVNPFLASLNNQTINTKQEASAAFSEEFATDPMQRGWYFDFDMLAIGRKADPEHEAAVMSMDSIPYRWDQTAKNLQTNVVTSTPRDGQRQRFVRPLSAAATHGDFLASMEFRIESFNSNASNPIVMGLFSSERPMQDQSLSLQLAGLDRIHVVAQLNGVSEKFPIEVPEGIRTEQTYRIDFDYSASTRTLRSALTDLALDADSSSSMQTTLPKGLVDAQLNEFGVALVEELASRTSPQSEYRYVVSKTEFTPN